VKKRAQGVAPGNRAGNEEPLKGREKVSVFMIRKFAEIIIVDNHFPLQGWHGRLGLAQPMRAWAGLYSFASLGRGEGALSSKLQKITFPRLLFMALERLEREGINLSDIPLGIISMARKSNKKNKKRIVMGCR